MPDNTSANTRIAKNTIVLYVRTFVTMLVSLYTSRVVLNALGVEDYGIYSVVAGFVSLLTILSGSLSSAISRFITYELGKTDKSRLSIIFSTSLLIQVAIAILILIIGETLGLWAFQTYISIPIGREWASNWVFHCSLAIFVLNLLYVPYNACIIAHERMTAYAYIGIIDVILKLGIALLISYATYDKLICYSILLLIQSIILGSAYIIYCRKKFEECKYQRRYDKSLVKEMTGFAGWAFLTSGAGVINTQGISIIINVFFGVVMNAARGIASQVEAVILKFVNDFTTAINPQIIKCYAEGDNATMYMLICRGAKFSYFLLLLLSLPIIYEAELILTWWLKIVPEHTVSFFRLTMLSSMIIVLGNTSITACMASGKIKNYTIVLTSIGLLVCPLTILAYYLGMPAECCYLIYICIYTVILIVRLFFAKYLVGFPISMFFKNVIVPVIFTSLLALLLPSISYFSLNKTSLLSFFVTIFLCVLGTSASVFFFGLTSVEKKRIVGVINAKWHILIK